MDISHWFESITFSIRNAFLLTLYFDVKNKTITQSKSYTALNTYVVQPPEPDVSYAV